MSSYSYDNYDCCPIDGYCEAIVQGLTMVNGVNNTTFKATPVGTLQMLWDPENRQDAEYILQDEGTVRKIRVKRIPRSTEADAVEGAVCGDPNLLPYVEQCVTVSKAATISFQSTLQEMQRYCAVESQIIQAQTGAIPGEQIKPEAMSFFNAHLQRVMSVMNGLREKINAMVTTEILANIGINVSTGTNAPFTLDMIDSVTGGKLEKGIQLLTHQMTDNEVYGTYLISGFGVFDRFNTSMQYGCCNQWGINWDAMNASAPYKFYKDLKLKDLTGNPDIFLALAPGTVQFVNYSNVLLQKLDNKRHGTFLHGTVIDPLVPGLRYDVAIEELNCSNNMLMPLWNINIYCNFDLAFIPDNAFKAGQDRLHPSAGMSNGVFQYLAAAV